MKMLFVCEGNMMRSQMAELFYNSLTESNDATSAGATAETKDHISPRAIEAMAAVGLDASGLRPKQVTRQMVESAQRIVYFPSDYMPDYVTGAENAELWDVADPHYFKDKGMPFVYEVRDDIKASVEKLSEGRG